MNCETMPVCRHTVSAKLLIAGHSLLAVTRANKSNSQISIRYVILLRFTASTV